MFRKSISSVLITAVALAVILTVTAIVSYVSRSTYHLALEQQKQAIVEAFGGDATRSCPQQNPAHGLFSA